MTAELGADRIALAIAKIIAPLAFDESEWKGDDPGLMSELQAGALCKAEKILALGFGYDELPADLQAAADVFDLLDCNSVLATALKVCEPSSAELAAYEALVTPMPDGTLLIAVLVGEPPSVGDEQACVIANRLASPEACQLAARIEVSARGGGQA